MMLVRQAGEKRCFESQSGFETRLSMVKLADMEATCHLSKTDLMNVWTIFHLMHIEAVGGPKKQDKYLQGKDSVQLNRDQYESIRGLEQNRYRNELGCLFNSRGQCSLTYEELADLYSSMSKVAKPVEKAKLAFCMYDLDMDGKLDKTDLGNIVLRLVFDMPPLLETAWHCVEPRLRVHEYTEEERKQLRVIVAEMQEGLKNSDPPYILSDLEGFVIANELNSYVEEALDEASHDIWDPNQEEDTRAIHLPDFLKSIERNPEFGDNFHIPIVPPEVPGAIERRAKQTFHIVADMSGAGGGSPGSVIEGPSWIHPSRPVILSDRVEKFAKIKAAHKKGKKKHVQLGEEYSEYDHTEETSAWDDFMHWIEVKKEAFKQQDPNPLWRHSLLTMEGHFGTGIGSVFRLYRWFFIMNLYIAATWLLFVILPVLGAVSQAFPIICRHSSLQTTRCIHMTYLQGGVCAYMTCNANVGAGVLRHGDANCRHRGRSAALEFHGGERAFPIIYTHPSLCIHRARTVYTCI